MLTGHPDRSRVFDFSAMKCNTHIYLRNASKYEKSSKVYLQLASEYLEKFPQEIAAGVAQEIGKV